MNIIQFGLCSGKIPALQHNAGNGLMDKHTQLNCTQIQTSECYSMAYLATSSFSRNCNCDSAISATSSTMPYCGMSRHSSTLGRRVLFSSLVCTTIIGGTLSASDCSRPLISASTSAISCSVCCSVEWKSDYRFVTQFV